MAWVNYHSHSLYCDGKAFPEDYVNQAVEKGFPAWGYSSHAPVPFASMWNMPSEKLPEYLEELTRIKSDYSGKIQVYKGLEIDYIEGLWGSRQSGLINLPIDFTIGSVHYIGQLPDGSHFCFDGQPEGFFKGIELLYQNDFRKAITTYYQAEMRMAEVDNPDIIGHMDKIKMHNAFRPYLNEEEKWYVSLVEETLEVIRQKGNMVEVNTRGLYKHMPPLLYPGKWVLERIHRKKIPILLNSDSHHPDEIDSGFAYAAELLLGIGFQSLRVLIDGKWQDKAFDKNGLLF
ncbi:MAG: histidinol-phosphatase [Bacteroidales bacterium]|nr:histidinol-phosphatase [Bacteroidales bacterium]